jgi:hypothetical protein
MRIKSKTWGVYSPGQTNPASLSGCAARPSGDPMHGSPRMGICSGASAVMDRTNRSQCGLRLELRTGRMSGSTPLSSNSPSNAQVHVVSRPWIGIQRRSWATPLNQGSDPLTAPIMFAPDPAQAARDHAHVASQARQTGHRTAPRVPCARGQYSLRCLECGQERCAECRHPLRPHDALLAQQPAHSVRVGRALAPGVPGRDAGPGGPAGRRP